MLGRAAPLKVHDVGIAAIAAAARHVGRDDDDPSCLAAGRWPRVCLLRQLNAAESHRRRTPSPPKIAFRLATAMLVPKFSASPSTRSPRPRPAVQPRPTARGPHPRDGDGAPVHYHGRTCFRERLSAKGVGVRLVTARDFIEVDLIERGANELALVGLGVTAALERLDHLLESLDVVVVERDADDLVMRGLQRLRLGARRDAPSRRR